MELSLKKGTIIYIPGIPTKRRNYRKPMTDHKAKKIEGKLIKVSDRNKSGPRPAQFGQIKSTAIAMTVPRDGEFRRAGVPSPCLSVYHRRRRKAPGRRTIAATWQPGGRITGAAWFGTLGAKVLPLWGPV